MPKILAISGTIKITHFLHIDRDQRYSFSSSIANGEKLEESHKLEKSIVSIMAPYQGAFHCTGTILTKNSILTAAHCLINNSRPVIINGKKYSIARNIIHPIYGKAYSLLDDIAIIKLKEEIAPRDFHPITLYQGEIIPRKAKLIGRSTFITTPYQDHAMAILKILVKHKKNNLSNDLLDYILNMPVSKSSLKNSKNESFTLTTYRSQSLNEKNGSTLYYNNLKGGPLPGDSGSPLFMEDKHGNFFQMGVTQYVMMNHKYPMLYEYHVHDSTAYANVSYYLNWIKEMAQKYDLGEIKISTGQEKKLSQCDEVRLNLNEVFIERLGTDLVDHALEAKCPQDYQKQLTLVSDKTKQCQKFCGEKDQTCRFAVDSLASYRATYQFLCGH